MNIFFLYTPLHTLIAARIVEEKKLMDYIVIFVGRNDKDFYYFTNFAALASKSFYYEKNNLLVLTLKLFLLSLKLVNKKQFSFYTGHPKTFLTRVFLLFKNFSFYTLDDGFGNINPDPKAYFRLNNENFYSIMFFKILDRRLLYYNLKESIITHYTIFKQQNVFRNCQYIQLIEKIKTNKIQLKRINILLSSDFTESGVKNLNFERNVYEMVVKRHNIDVIVEHPASNLKKFDQNYNHKIYKGKLIAEDYIIQLSKNSLAYVYGFQCTTLFVLENLSENIVVYDLGDFSKYN